MLKQWENPYQNELKSNVLKSNKPTYEGGTYEEYPYLPNNSDNAYRANVALSEKPQNKEFYYSDYDSKIRNLLGSMEEQNQKGFQYNYADDPAYQAYRKEYLRNGQRATQDAMASASAMTGGRPSSYAATAAAQAGNNYAAQLSDKIPELYNQAYNRYLQQYQQQAQMLNAYQNQGQNEYNRFSQERAYNYGVNQDYISNLLKAADLEENNAYRSTALAMQNKQNIFQNMQSQQQQEWNMWIQQANTALNIGDYKTLESMGFDVSNIRSDADRARLSNKLAAAQIIAQITGDTSLVRDLFNKV